MRISRRLEQARQCPHPGTGVSASVSAVGLRVSSAFGTAMPDSIGRKDAGRNRQHRIQRQHVEGD
eukprot:521022-Amphidinium_carterae.3